MSGTSSETGEPNILLKAYAIWEKMEAGLKLPTAQDKMMREVIKNMDEGRTIHLDQRAVNDLWKEHCCGK